MPLVLLLLKASLGAGLFVLILWWAQSRQPRAGGLMLTFPAINGLGLLTAEVADHLVLARAMLPMIALNGLLCAGYIVALRSGGIRTSRRHAALLLVICCSLWALMALYAAPWLQTFSHATPQVLAWLGGYSLLGVLLTMWGLWTPQAATTASQRSLTQVLRANTLRIGVMLALLMLVTLLARHGAETWAGRLSALPLIPFYSLWSLAPHQTQNPEAATRLGHLGSTVLGGPLVAMAFAWVFAHYLNALPWPHGSLAALLAGVSGLLALWGSCGLLIWGLLRGLHALEARQMLMPVAASLGEHPHG